MTLTKTCLLVSTLVLTVGCVSPDDAVEPHDGAGGKADNTCGGMIGGSCPGDSSGRSTVVISNEINEREVEVAAATRAEMRVSWSEFQVCGFGGIPVIGATAAGDLIIDGSAHVIPTTAALTIQQVCLGGVPFVIENQPGPTSPASVRAALDLLETLDETTFSIQQAIELHVHDPMFESFAALLGVNPQDWREVVRDEQLVERLLSETGVFSARERVIVRVEEHKQTFTDGRPPQCGQVTIRKSLFDLPSLHVSDVWLRLDSLDTHVEERISIDCADFGR